jgi:hypothetical protein
MTGLDLWPLIGAFVAGVALGTVIAGGVVLEREFFWTVCVRLPDALHRKLAAPWHVSPARFGAPEPDLEDDQ